MKIHSVGQSVSVPPNGGARERDLEQKTASGDRAQLTSLSAFIAAAQSNSPERLARMSRLTAAVSNGGYHVDAGLLSNRIIEDSFGAIGA